MESVRLTLFRLSKISPPLLLGGGDTLTGLRTERTFFPRSRSRARSCRGITGASLWWPSNAPSHHRLHLSDLLIQPLSLCLKPVKSCFQNFSARRYRRFCHISLVSNTKKYLYQQCHRSYSIERSVSHNIVTGPSFTRLSRMSAPKIPVATATSA